MVKRVLTSILVIIALPFILTGMILGVVMFIATTLRQYLERNKRNRGILEKKDCDEASHTKRAGYLERGLRKGVMNENPCDPHVSALTCGCYVVAANVPGAYLVLQYCDPHTAMVINETSPLPFAVHESCRGYVIPADMLEGEG